MRKAVAATFLLLSMGAIGAMAESMTGFVGDSKCKHDGSNIAKDTKCAKACIEKGAAPVFVSDGKVLKLDADSAAKAKELAGEKVTVDGSVSGDTLTIASIKKAE